MDETNFYSLTQEQKIILIEGTIGSRGKYIKHTSGMCGEIYILDQSGNSYPRYVCAKIPKPFASLTINEISKRFVRELKMQLSFSQNRFVHWAFDFDEIAGVPSASFRYWGSDLQKIIIDNNTSAVSKLTLMLYTCLGLKHCYRKGLIAHQDLKPANIFIRNLKKDFNGLPDLDIYNIALVADFGLANAFIDYNIYDGSRPYMAPEQWNKEELTSATDVFALGIILYELFSGGYHPVGIKLNDFWPVAKDGNSKKWTKERDWKKWISSECKITICPSIIDINIYSYIERMLSIDPKKRPEIDDVIDFFFENIKKECSNSYNNLNMIINDSNQDFTNLDLKETKPYLYNKWKKFEIKFA